MTGRYSIRSGIGISPAQYAPNAPGPSTSNTVLAADAIGGLPLNETTLAELIKPAGYKTMMIGKVRRAAHNTAIVVSQHTRNENA